MGTQYGLPDSLNLCACSDFIGLIRGHMVRGLHGVCLRVCAWFRSEHMAADLVYVYVDVPLNSNVACVCSHPEKGAAKSPIYPSH